MSRKQIERDFKELYQEKNQKSILDNYYKEKKKSIILVFMAGMFLSLLLFYSDYQKLQPGEGNRILRKEETGASEQIKLQVKREEEEWEEIEFDLRARQWTRQELEEAFVKMTEELEGHILGENSSLDQVKTDLSFVTELAGYPFVLSWESMEPELIDNTGKLQEKILKEITPVSILMKASYYDWQEEFLFYITLPKTEESDWITGLREYLIRGEENTREEGTFYLPKSFQGKEISWKFQGKSSGIYVPLITLILMAVVWQEKDREIRKKTERKRQELIRDYPGFISRLVLYLGTGISIKESFFRIQQEYEEEEHSYLKEEISYACNQMKNGQGEQKVYEDLGRRCKTAEYRKLAALLIQQREKGSYHLLTQLKKEMEAANEEQYKRLKRQGEEMGTKLLLPMMMLLGMVMALIMLPALLSF